MHADESELKGLTSNITRNSAFVKKLRQALGEEHARDALLAEFHQLNLTKFVSELPAAVAEAKLKGADVPAAVRLCSAVHQRYADFAQPLMAQLHKAALALQKSPALPGVPAESEQERAAKLLRKRTLVRLLVELFLAGVSTDASLLLALLHDLLAGAAAEHRDKLDNS